MSRARQPHPRRAPLSIRPRLTPVAAVCVGLLSAPLLALAQAEPAPGKKLDTVTVTGFRASLETSISTKRNADAIVESVSAEDIGKLPDVSIADAISRLPGLTTQRIAGRSSVISIRGMAPRYGVTLLNGREIVSTGDNRSVEYDQFPSELINAATVYKTPDASLSAQGLSGTVNMKTLRPLDFSKTQAVVGARLERNSNGSLNPEISGTGNRLSASYVTQSADRTWGAAVGFAHLDSPNQEKHYKSWWWANTNDWGSPLPGAPTDAVALQGFELGAASSRQKRDGLMGVLEYKPNADFHSTLDLYYSKFDQTEARRTVMADMSTWAGVSWSNAQTTVVNGDKIVTSGIVNNTTPVALTTFNKRRDDIRAIGWNNELKLADWKLVGDLSWSKAKRDEQNAELQAGSLGRVSLGQTTIATGDGLSTFAPSFDFGDAKNVYLSDPSGWGRDGRSQFPKVRDQIKAFKLTAARSFESWLSSFEAGLDYSERDKSMNRTEVNYNLKNGRAPMLIPSNLLRGPTDLSFAGSNIRMVNFDLPSALSLYDVTPTALDQAPGRIWSVHEKVTAAHAKLGFEFDWGVPVHGNLGLRVVHAKQWSNGLLWNPATSSTVPENGGTSYTDTLPSFNLAADVTANTIVRFGLAKVMARPNMEDMRAGFRDISVGQMDRKWSASGGNPKLEPWRADAADLSVEHYFSKRSYVAAAAFYKKIKNFVYSQSIDFDFTGFPNPTAYTPISNIGTLTTQANGKGGMIAGTELSGSLDGSLISPALDGIGVTLSYSDTRSSLHEDNDVSKPLDGLSGKATNFTVYYERNGVSARLGSRHRSPFVTMVRGTFGENVPSMISSETIIDAQVGYAFETGSLKGLSLTLQVNNLRDRPYRTRVGISTGSKDPNATLPERYTTYGRQFLLGGSYKF
ncbi:TonB-dependent receptor [Roseateles sp.]|uniref:TonB-dependent receptor n=1 Tax=Roseateles sp. TaxID=1971397 RepID=UPI0025E4055A|nr:TonB-dependent receptor [Roseateles sp.]